MTEPSQAELVAFEVVRRVTGSEVVHYDTGGRQGAVDALIRYKDDSAALEVTILTDAWSRQLEVLLGREDFKWHCPDLRWWWSLELSPQTRISHVKARICELLTWCESHDIAHPDASAFTQAHHDAAGVLEWMFDMDISVIGHPASALGPGVISVAPAAKGGAVGDVEEVAPWLTRELTSPRTQRKVQKLASSEQERCELFLIVDDSGAPFAGFYALAFGDGVPSNDPVVPTDVDAVWLAPRWSQAVLRWQRQGGVVEALPLRRSH